jgi:transcriptional regulator with XRE-family HTH domain
MNALGLYLRERCAQRGLSMSELARRAGKSRQTLLTISTTTGRLPAMETLVELALVLELHPLRLVQLVFEDFAMPKRHSQAFKQRGDKSVFVADVTVPDGQVMAPGTRFTKTWAMQNVGTVAWENRVLACVDDEVVVSSLSGERLTIAERLRPLRDRVEVPYTAPGATVLLSVEFKTPSTPGSCVSYWKSFFADGRACFPGSVGLSCYVRVVTMRSTGDALG